MPSDDTASRGPAIGGQHAWQGRRRLISALVGFMVLIPALVAVGAGHGVGCVP